MPYANPKSCKDCAAPLVTRHGRAVYCIACNHKRNILHARAWAMAHKDLLNARRRKGGQNARKEKTLGKALDGRRKLTDPERADIISRYKQGEGIRSIARIYSFVSRRLVQFVLFPDRMRHLQETVKKEKRWKKYYTTESRREYQRKHRARVKSLLTKQEK